MQTSSGLPYRRSVRLKDWTYRDATFFITICAHEKRCLFGRVEADRVILSPLGKIVEREWRRSKEIRPDVIFDSHIVMPNHIHALVCVPAIKDEPSRRKRTLGSLVNGFKGAVTRAVVQRVWQRGYHEHVVRNERELALIRTYIYENPLRWAADRYFVD
jgi:REP element-mobilizing transposase RayT